MQNAASSNKSRNPNRLHGIWRQLHCSTILGILASLVTAAAGAQNIDLRYDNKVQASQPILALSDNALGEYINDYSGATSFTHIDATLPGNSLLPVTVGRTFSVEDKYGVNSLGGFGDWDIDVPYLMGTFSSSMGWSVDTVTSPNRYKRCSVQTVPQIGNLLFDVHEVWSGYQLHLPGGENGELLKASYSDTYPDPTDGATYPWITQAQSRLRCLAQTKNGYPGEGFVLVANTGQTYYFDWGVEVAIRGIGKNSSRTIGRKRIYLLASRVEDKSGNWVNYSYTGTKLTSISANDGRQINLTYTGDRISSTSSSAGTWTYEYDGSGNLTTVNRPDASSWKFSYTGSLKVSPPVGVPPMDSWDPPTCDEQFPGQNNYEYRVTHPSGLTGQFKFTQRRFYRALVRWMCTQTPSPDKFEWLVIPNYFDGYALQSRTLTGPGISAQTSSYDYGAEYESLGFCASSPYSETNCVPYCPPSTIGWCNFADGRWITITAPDGTKIRRYLGARYGVDEGRLLVEEVIDKQGTVVSRTANEYVTDQQIGSMPFSADVGTRLTRDAAVSKVRPAKAHITVQNGTEFKSVIEAFDTYARPVRITKSSSPVP